MKNPISIMKHFLVMMILMLPLFSQGQVTMDFGAGAARVHEESEKGIVNTIMPAIKISIGYEISNVVAEIIGQPTLTNAVNSPNYFGAKLGYDFKGFIASAGYLYNLCNSDLPENNKGSFGYSLKYQVSINENGGLYAEVIKINKATEATIGFQIVF